MPFAGSISPERRGTRDEQSGSRVACLYVPEFPLAALLRAQPDRGDELLVVADGEGARARLLAVSPQAARAGIRPGLSVAQARAIATRVSVGVVAEDQLRAARAALCDVAESFSPRIEDAGPGVVYLDVSRLASFVVRRSFEDLAARSERRWMEGDEERQLATALSQRAAYLGLPAQVGIAGSKVAAYLAARDGSGMAVIPPGEEWNFLAPVPVSLLQPSAALAATLQRWGIRTIGELAALPRSAVSTRLGAEGAALVARARGEDDRPLVPRPLLPRFEESLDLDYGIETVEPFLFVARGLLDRLTARLAVRGLVCGDLHLSLRLATRGRDDRTVVVGAPSNEVKALLSLLRVHLEAHPPAAAIESVRLGAVAEKLRAAQLDLFEPSGPAPLRLAVTLARLTAICGDEHVGLPAIADSHRPDAYGLKPLNPQSPLPRSLGSKREDGCTLTLRMFRPPTPVEVFCQRDRPEFVRGGSMAGRVVQLAGPWRHSGDWWSECPYARDYYDAQLSDGGVYRLYRELDGGSWFVEGSYD